MELPQVEVVIAKEKREREHTESSTMHARQPSQTKPNKGDTNCERSFCSLFVEITVPEPIMCRVFVFGYPHPPIVCILGMLRIGIGSQRKG